MFLILYIQLSVYRSVQLVSYVGCSHKNTVARTTSASLLAAVAEKLGQDRLMRRRERATLETMIKSGVQLLKDGSLDTRTEAKKIFKVIMEHQEFQDCLEDAVSSYNIE